MKCKKKMTKGQIDWTLFKTTSKVVIEQGPEFRSSFSLMTKAKKAKKAMLVAKVQVSAATDPERRRSAPKQIVSVRDLQKLD